MKDHLDRLAAQALDRLDAARPRLVSRFEPVGDPDIAPWPIDRAADVAAPSPPRVPTPHRGGATASAGWRSRAAASILPSAVSDGPEPQAIASVVTPATSTPATAVRAIDGGALVSPASTPADPSGQTPQHEAPQADAILVRDTAPRLPIARHGASAPPSRGFAPEAPAQVSTPATLPKSEIALDVASPDRPGSVVPPPAVHDPLVSPRGAQRAIVASRRQSAATKGDNEPAIQVNIGRIEVRAAVSESTPARAAARPPAVMGLDEYLRRRAEGRHS